MDSTTRTPPPKHPPAHVRGDASIGSSHAAGTSDIAQMSTADGQPFTDIDGELSLNTVLTIGHDVFRIVELLGKGGMGYVYRAAQERMVERQVAIKVPTLRLSHDMEIRRSQELLLQESQAAASLNHPNIVTLYHVARTGNGTNSDILLIFEYLSGETVQELLQRESALPWNRCVGIASAVAAALTHAHLHEIIHRDIKPSNIFLCADGNTKVIDFGLAHRGFRNSVASEVVSPQSGTPRYMAPEQWAGETSDVRTDIWLLGATLYEMLTGHPPYDGPGYAHSKSDPPAPVSTQGVHVPDELDWLVQWMLTPDRTLRCPSAADALHRLKSLSDRESTGNIQGPFRFLEPFSEADSQWYFGRQEEVQRLVARLEQTRLIALIGPSGIGKSSLLRAGLVPELRRRPDTIIVITTPGMSPSLSLARHLEEAGLSVASQNRDTVGIAHARERINAATSKLVTQHTQVLLLVDQAEEAVDGVAAASYSDFGELIASMLQMFSPALRVILSIRQDQLFKFSSAASLWVEIQNGTFPLGEPDRFSLTDMVRGPVNKAGYRWEDGLVEQIVHDVAEIATPLPYLQVTLSLLWQHRKHKELLLSFDSYNRLGGVSQIVSRHADNVILSLPSDQHRMTAKLLLTALVSADEQPQRIPRSDLRNQAADPDRADAVLSHLLSARLLHESPEDGTVRLVSDSLVENWKKLRDWLHDDASQLRLKRELVAAAQLWQRDDHPRSLLWRGPRLWNTLHQHSAGLELGIVETRFIEASYRNERRRKWGAGVAILVAAIITVTVIMVIFSQNKARQTAQEIAELERALSGATTADQDRDYTTAVPRYRYAASLQRSRMAPEIGESASAARLHQLALEQSAARVVAQSSRPIYAGSLSPNGDQLAIGLEDGGVEIWRVADGVRSLSTRLSNKPITKLQWINRSELMAAIDSGGGLHVVSLSGSSNQNDVLPGEKIKDFEVDEDTGFLVALDTKGTTRTAQLQDLARPNPTWSTLEPCGGSPAATIAAARSRLIVTCNAGTVIEMDLATQIWTYFPYVGFKATFSTVSPGGNLLLVGGQMGDAVVFDVGTRTVLGTFKMQQEVVNGDVKDFVNILRGGISNDESTVVLSSSSHTCFGKIAESKLDRCISGHLRPTNAFAFCNDSPVLAVGSLDGTMSFWNTWSGTNLQKTSGHDGAIAYAECRTGPLGQRLYTYGLDGSVREWVLPSSRLRIPKAETRWGGYWSLAMSKDATMAMWGGTDGRIHRYRFDGHLFQRLDSPHHKRVLQVVMTPDGKYAASTSMDGVAAFWNDSSETPTAVAPAQNLWSVAMGSSPDKLVVADVENDQLMAWDPRRNTLTPFWGTDEEIDTSQLEFSPSGNFVAASMESRTKQDRQNLILFRFDGPVPHPVPLTTSDAGHSIAFSPDELLVVGGGLLGNVGMWRTNTAERVFESKAHMEHVVDVVFSEDGQQFVSLGADRVAHVWSVVRASKVATFPNHDAYPYSATFSRDSKMVITGAMDGKLRYWDIGSQLLLASFDGFGGNVGAVGLTGDGGYVRAATAQGVVGEWPLLRLTVDETIRMTGEATNMRICPNSQKVVPVLPYPPADSIFAPEELCAGLEENDVVQ